MPQTPQKELTNHCKDGLDKIAKQMNEGNCVLTQLQAEKQEIKEQTKRFAKEKQRWADEKEAPSNRVTRLESSREAVKNARDIESEATAVDRLMEMEKEKDRLRKEGALSV